MNKLLVGAMSAAMLATVSGVAYADDATSYPNNYSSTEYHPNVSSSYQTHDRFRGGFDLSLGAPSGAEVGFVFQPFTHWTRLELGLAHDGLSFGGMASATFTPIKFPIMPVLQVETGFFPQGKAPSFLSSGHTLPSVGYDYLSVGPGLEFGNRDHAVFFIHPALTYMNVHTGNFQAVVNNNGGSDSGLVLSNPSAHGWIMPTARLGFAVMF
jgi:hypothetical protein